MVTLMSLSDVVSATVSHTGAKEIDLLSIEVEHASDLGKQERHILGDFDFQRSIPIHIICIQGLGTTNLPVDAILVKAGYIKDTDGAAGVTIYKRKCGPWRLQEPC